MFAREASDFTSIYRGNNKSRCTGRGSRPNTQRLVPPRVRKRADSRARALGHFRNLPFGAHAACAGARWWRQLFHRAAYNLTIADWCDIA